VPQNQLKEAQRHERASDLVILGDIDQSLKDWFGRHRKSVVVLRPDRFVAAAAIPVDFQLVSRHFMTIFPGSGMEIPSAQPQTS
jgi:3-(3-hydroxy-phenyl)propionate hydroxylase